MPAPDVRWLPEGIGGPAFEDDPAAFEWTDDGFRQHFRDRVDHGLQDLVDDPACDRALMTHIENALAH